MHQLPRLLVRCLHDYPVIRSVLSCLGIYGLVFG